MPTDQDLLHNHLASLSAEQTALHLRLQGFTTGEIDEIWNEAGNWICARDKSGKVDQKLGRRKFQRTLCQRLISEIQIIWPISELSSDIGRFNSQKEMEVHRLKDDRENGIRVESFQSEQCKKASVQIQCNGYWPGLQVGRLTTDTKDLQLLPLPHKVKALHCGELYQETLHAWRPTKRKALKNNQNWLFWRTNIIWDTWKCKTKFVVLGPT